MWFPVIFLLAGISYVLAVAPGDFESRCRSNSVSGGKNLRDFPDNWKILMDTYDYRQLYQPAGRIGRFWVNKDIDGDGQTVCILHRYIDMVYILCVKHTHDQVVYRGCYNACTQSFMVGSGASCGQCTIYS